MSCQFFSVHFEQIPSIYDFATGMCKIQLYIVHFWTKMSFCLELSRTIFIDNVNFTHQGCSNIRLYFCMVAIIPSRFFASETQPSGSLVRAKPSLFAKVRSLSCRSANKLFDSGTYVGMRKAVDTSTFRSSCCDSFMV